jgi:hypothetical protein
MTRSTLGISRPLDATSVATRTLNLPSLNRLRVTSLWFYAMSPCMTSMSFLILSESKS